MIGGLLDDIKNSLTGAYSSAVQATNDQLKSLFAKADELRALGQQMLIKTNQLRGMEGVARRDPALFAEYQRHLQRGETLKANVNSVLSKVDAIIAQARAMGLGVVPVIAAGLVLSLMGVVATVAYAINAYIHDTDVSLQKLQIIRDSGGTPVNLTQATVALSKGDAVSNAGSSFFGLKNGVMLIAAGAGLFFVYRIFSNAGKK